MVSAHLTGVFPRSEKLIEVTRAAERGTATVEELDAALRRDLTALIELQSNSTLDFLVDGQLNWQDLFRPFSKLFTGINPGSLSRWFDNNTFYRKPIIDGKVRFDGSNVEAHFRSELLPSEAHKKAILPGPFTFATLSQNEAYSSLADLVDDLAHAVRDTAAQLVKAGYEYIQFDEPCILRTVGKNELELARRALDVCAKGCGAETGVHTYFADAGPVVETLLDSAPDFIGVDFYATSLESILQYDFDKGLGCGCIDGRNSLLESPSELRGFVGRVTEKLNPKGLFICPNCDLEFLPYPVAEKKVHILSETKRLVA